MAWRLCAFANKVRDGIAQTSGSRRIWLAAGAGGLTAILSNAVFNFQLAVPPTLILFFTCLAIPEMIKEERAEMLPASKMRFSLQIAATTVVVIAALWL